jgi:hypothetical protein
MLPAISSNSNGREDDRAKLAWLVEHFEHDASGSRKLIRAMLHATPEAFLRDAMAVVRDRPDARGSEYVVTLLVANNLLLAALCDPGISREQTRALARAALRVDSMADMTLAKALANLPEGLGDVVRLMEILDEISDGDRIFPALLRLMHHENPHIRSKAVLMIGRGGRGVRWAERLLADENPRVRANAIESMWGMDGPEARALLQAAVRDPNNRVAGNAMLGLYLTGDSTTIPEILKMAAGEVAVWRSTGVWVMGQTGDPRFLKAIAERLRDGDPMVRRRAYSALGRIKTEAAKVARTAEWRMGGCFRPAGQGDNTRRLVVALAAKDGKEVPPLLSTQFLLAEDGNPVEIYKVVEREIRQALSVAFVFPKSAGRPEPAWLEGALRALDWKSASASWGLYPYLPEGERQTAPGRAPGGEAVFRSKSDAILTGLLQAGSAPSYQDLWTAVGSAVQGLDQLVRGNGRVIVFSSAEESSAASQGLISSIVTAPTAVEVVSVEGNPPLQDFCRRTHGFFRRVSGEEEISAAIEQVYVQLLARYEISYQPVCLEARDLKIRAHTSSGWAEMALPIPTEPSG